MKKLISLLLFSMIMCISAVGCSAAEGNSGNASDFIPNPNVRQTIYFWDEGNMPAETEYTVNNGSYSDPPEFRPYMIFVPAAEGTEIKGAVMINPGGAFQFRSDAEGLPVAEELSKYGYQCFVVNYRLRPYTQEEGALDLARGVRFVRKHADIYGINPNNIASIGFSAGGILSGELALNFDGLENGTKLDTDYIPDELDNISADVSAEGMFYSFYGRLSVASTNKETLAAGNLPPTYFCYGSNEVFRSQIENQIGILDEIGAKTNVNMLEGYNHGFGSRGNWAVAFDKWLDGVFIKSAVTGIEISSARINGNKLDYSVAVQGDKSNANIILALYDENTVLCNVHVNKTEGAFDINPYSKYTLKLFALEKGTMKPLTDGKTIENLGGSQLTQYLNNSISGTDGDIHYTHIICRKIMTITKAILCLLRCRGTAVFLIQLQQLRLPQIHMRTQMQNRGRSLRAI